MTEPYDEIENAAEVLRAGGLVAFPTETVYGLGADAANPDAIRRLFAVKGRPPTHPVIAHLARVEQLDEYAIEIPDIARELAAAFWPGPLTLVVRRRAGAIADEVTGGRDTVGLRVPDHPLALALLDGLGGAIAAPSANRFGNVSPTTAAHVRADVGADVDVILDGGPCRVGVESTIVDVTGAEPSVLRVGGVGEEQLQVIAGHAMPRRTAGEVAAPGTLEHHYAPNAPIELVDARDLDRRVEELRAKGRRVGVVDAPSDADEYAHVLYARLRAADAEGAETIVAVVPADDGGLAAAVVDRLRRAATR